MKNKSPLAMKALAAHLFHQRKIILKRWRKATEEAAGVTVATSLTRVQFNDHIPKVLDAYNRVLLAWPGVPSASSQLDEKKQINEHSLQRWQQGYQLQDLTREWGHLSMSVTEELDLYAQENPALETSVMTAVRHS